MMIYRMESFHDDPGVVFPPMETYVRAMTVAQAQQALAHAFSLPMEDIMVAVYSDPIPADSLLIDAFEQDTAAA